MLHYLEEKINIKLANRCGYRKMSTFPLVLVT